MATYRSVQMSFWTDSKVMDDFTPEDKLFFLYIMTNPRTSLCGCYECSKKQMSRDIGYSEETISNIIYRMDKIHGVAKYDENTKEILILNWDKYNWLGSSKVFDGAYKGAIKIKSETFRYYTLKKLEQRGYPVPQELLENIPYGYPMDITVTFPFTFTDNVSVYDSESINESDNTTDEEQQINVPTRFKRPSLDEVQSYISENNYHVDASSFIDFYQSKGWKVGNQPMKDWKACVRTWERREKDQKKTQTKPKGNTLSEEMTHGYDMDELRRRAKE